MLECLGDLDFLAKLHCVRQAWQVQFNQMLLIRLHEMTNDGLHFYSQNIVMEMLGSYLAGCNPRINSEVVLAT